MRWPLALLPFVFAGAMAAADLAVDAPRVVTDSRVFHDVVAAANGGNAVVAWAHDNSAVKVARVRGDGTVLDVPARFVERGDKPEIACGGGRCIVAAIRDAAVVATLLDVDGAPLRSIVLGPPGSFVSISSDLTNDDSGLKTAASDDRFVVAWTSGYYESTAAVLTRDGDAIAHATLAGRIVAASGYGGDVALATMENLTAGPLLLFRVGRDGRVTAGATIFDDLLLYAGRMALASSPTGSLLVVSGRQLFNGSYRGAVGAITLDTALQALAGSTLSTMPDLVASRVSAVWDGARYAVGFSEGSGLDDVLLLGDKKLQFQGVDEATLAMSGSDVFVASNSRRWTAVGYRVSAPEPIAVGFTVVEQHAPLLATDGRSALVGWSEDGRSCCIEWLGPSGIRHPIDVGDVPSYLRLAFDGHNYVATWSVQSAAYAQFFRPNGQPLGPRRRAGFGAATRAVWTGREFVTIDTSAFGAVVAKMEDGTGRELGELGQRSLFVDAVADGGDVVIALVDVDRDELQLVRFSGGAVVERRTVGQLFDFTGSLASSGDGFLVAWNSRDRAISMQRLDRHFVPVGMPFQLAPKPGRATIAWDGSAYVVGWESTGDIAAARVSASGEMRLLAALAASSDDESEPVLAAANGALAFAYVRNVSEAPINNAPRGFPGCSGSDVPPRHAAGR